MPSGVFDLERSLPVFGDFFNGDGIEEGHGGAELFADDLDGVLGFRFAEGHELLAAGVLVGEESLRKSAVLDFGEDLLHCFLALVIDDARAADVVAPLGRVGDGVAHVGKAAAIDEIDDEFELVQDFEVGTLGLVAGFGEGFVARLDEGADAAAEHSLLAEEVGLSLFLERGFEHSGACAADALEVAETQRVGLAGRVLVDCDEAGDAAAFSEDFTYAMAWGLWCGHAYINARSGNDGLEMNVESVREHEQLSCAEVRSNLVRIQFGRSLIWNENHDHVAPFCGLGDGYDFKAGLLRLGDGLGGCSQANFYLDSRVLEVKSMGLPLGAVADNGHLFRLDEGEVCVVIVVCRSHDFLGFPFLVEIQWGGLNFEGPQS